MSEKEELRKEFKNYLGDVNYMDSFKIPGKNYANYGGALKRLTKAFWKIHQGKNKIIKDIFSENKNTLQPKNELISKNVDLAILSTKIFNRHFSKMCKLNERTLRYLRQSKKDYKLYTLLKIALGLSINYKLLLIQEPEIIQNIKLFSLPRRIDFSGVKFKLMKKFKEDKKVKFIDEVINGFDFISNQLTIEIKNPRSALIGATLFSYYKTDKESFYAGMRFGDAMSLDLLKLYYKVN